MTPNANRTITFVQATRTVPFTIPNTIQVCFFPIFELLCEAIFTKDFATFITVHEKVVTAQIYVFRLFTEMAFARRQIIVFAVFGQGLPSSEV